MDTQPVTTASSFVYHRIPTKVSRKDCNRYIEPHLHRPKKGPQPKLSLYQIFNDILSVLHTGIPWEQLQTNRQALHSTHVYTWHNRWSKDGAYQARFEASVIHLHHTDQLDTSVLHGDGANTVVKKGGKAVATPAINTNKATKSSPSWQTTALFSDRFRSNPSTNKRRAFCPKPSQPLWPLPVALGSISAGRLSPWRLALTPKPRRTPSTPTR
jgi:transposase